MTSPPSPAVAAVRPAARDVLFLAERDGAVAPVAAFDFNVDLIYEHGLTIPEKER